jgi:hypothetical protein
MLHLRGQPDALFHRDNRLFRLQKLSGTVECKFSVARSRHNLAKSPFTNSPLNSTVFLSMGTMEFKPFCILGLACGASLKLL